MNEAIVGNKAIEDAAIAFVIEFERAQGRAARDTRYRGAAADLESEGRLIEVKAVARTMRTAGFIPLEVRQIEAARDNASFFVYLVENVGQGNPRKFELRIIGGALLARLVSGAKERRYYELPIPAADYAGLQVEKVEQWAGRAK